MDERTVITIGREFGSGGHEMERIKADPELRKRLLPDEKDEEDND